jgi:recombination protein RecR
VQFAKPLAELIGQLEKLPGVGPKSAQRLAFHLIKQPKEESRKLADSIVVASENLMLAEPGMMISDSPEDPYMSDPQRDKSVVCVVSEPMDVAAMERMNEFKGVYHVLHGLLSPMEGIGPEDLKIKELLRRLEGDEIREVIVATNATVEGDTTALYLGKLIKPLGVRVTRLAHGMPIGGELDYADTATLLSALEYRREI